MVNPNIATVQTDPGTADKVYLEPLDVPTVTAIIKKEKPYAIALSFGGQTALNLGLALEEQGVLKKYGVKVLGTPVKSIRLTEDRDLFKNALTKIGVKTPRSFAATSVPEALSAAKKIGYPIMLRAGFSLGGLGSGKITTPQELADRAAAALHGAPQVLIEEYLAGWKEIEYEIVRDSADNAITVCNMENFDPMGIHTGESIVVAPSQTLTNHEYHMLRQVAIKVARAMGIVGECNIQYALNPKNGDYRVIEMNARLSRSSALASKATGYPLAFVAAKLALGKKLTDLKNTVTQKTGAFFEPALDYCVVKIPRWDLTKFKTADRRIGSEMKSVGEVMAIGRSFPEALQKAVRMLNIGASGLSDYPLPIPDLTDETARATDRRLFALYKLLLNGESVEKLYDLTKIDRWFLHQLKDISDFEKSLKRNKLNAPLLRAAKEFGFSDKTIAQLTKSTADKIRSLRLKHHVTPYVKQIDTLAGEYPAETNYLYTTYHGTGHDVAPGKNNLVVLGSGPYCIGSSVEFDWCAVNTARALRQAGKETIIINSNPETVSTDYDESDRLYFEELTLERVLDIVEFEHSAGVVVSVGGQIANTLSRPLAAAGVKLLGTSADSIDQAENRERFSRLLNTLKIDQPEWTEATSLKNVLEFSKRVGYPVIVRPSYILSGTAMNIVRSENELRGFLENAALISSEYPVVVSRFIDHAKEIEVDGVADHGQIVIDAITEHVENAGVHSGDATVVLPPQRLYMETVRRTKEVARAIVKALNITGPFNIQFLAKHNTIKVIECNVRASRSFPFVSKVTNHNFIQIATKILLGQKITESFNTLDLPHVGVKTPQFSYQRLKGADPIAGVEMASTGEVAVIGKNLTQAFFTSWRATEQTVAGKRILLTIGSEDNKLKLLENIAILATQGFDLYATAGTHDFLARHGIATTYVFKAHDERPPNALTLLSNKEVDLIINIPSGFGHDTATDGFKIRRLAVSHHIPIITNPEIAALFLECLGKPDTTRHTPKSWQEYMAKGNDK